MLEESWRAVSSLPSKNNASRVHFFVVVFSERKAYIKGEKNLAVLMVIKGLEIPNQDLLAVVRR